MNERTLAAAVIALVSFNLIACADPEPAAAGGDSAFTSAEEPARFVETYEPGSYAAALPASPDAIEARAVVAPSPSLAPISTGAALVGECRVRYASTTTGKRVVIVEGTSCLLDDITGLDERSAEAGEPRPPTGDVGAWDVDRE